MTSSGRWRGGRSWGVPFADTALWAYPVYSRGGRGFVVYYRFDEEEVTLESIVHENEWV